MKRKPISKPIQEELAFSRRYVENYDKGRRTFTAAGDKEFYERDTQKSVAARLVDGKALKDLKELMERESLRGFVVLDVGAGGGRQVKWLLNGGAKKVVWFDISKDFLKLAKKRLRGKAVEFVIGNAEELPFANNSFDLAFFSATLHHVEHPKKALFEAARVARMIALVSEPASFGWLGKFLALIGWNIEYNKLKCHRFSPQEIGRILAKKGFEVCMKRDFIWFPFGIFDRFKDNQPFLKLYFAFLFVLDFLFGGFGHNLTVFATKKKSFQKTQAPADKPGDKKSQIDVV